MRRIEKSFAALEYEDKKRRTRRELFLEKMEEVIPWEKLLEQIRPYYPSGEQGKRALPVKGDAAGGH